ncbi:MAG: hypothetical protein U0703_11925 [Anaerolineae bacterium]
MLVADGSCGAVAETVSKGVAFQGATSGDAVLLDRRRRFHLLEDGQAPLQALALHWCEA